MKRKDWIGKDRSLLYYPAKVDLEIKLSQGQFDEKTADNIKIILAETETRLSKYDIEQSGFILLQLLKGYDSASEEVRDNLYTRALQLTLLKKSYLVQPINDYLQWCRSNPTGLPVTVQVLNYSGKVLYYSPGTIQALKEAKWHNGVFIAWQP